jgi:hypothetical protein
VQITETDLRRKQIPAHCEQTLCLPIMKHVLERTTETIDNPNVPLCASSSKSQILQRHSNTIDKPLTVVNASQTARQLIKSDDSPIIADYLCDLVNSENEQKSLSSYEQNEPKRQSSSTIRKDGQTDTTHVASSVDSWPKQLVNTTTRDYDENSGDGLQIDIDDTDQPIGEYGRSYEIVADDIAVTPSRVITDISKPRARKKGKRQKHKLTMPAKRRVRPVKRNKLNRPSLLLKIHLAKDSEPNVIDTSDSSLVSGKSTPKKSKNKNNVFLLGRVSIFCAYDHPEHQVSATDAKEQKRGKKRKSVQGNIHLC